MNKAELIAAVAVDSNETKASVDRVLSSLMNVVTKSVSKGDDVALIGFGRFTATERAARDGRNPLTGKPMKIAAKRVPRFIPGAALRQAVAGKKVAKK